MAIRKEIEQAESVVICYLFLKRTIDLYDLRDECIWPLLRCILADMQHERQLFARADSKSRDMLPT